MTAVVLSMVPIAVGCVVCGVSCLLAFSLTPRDTPHLYCCTGFDKYRKLWKFENTRMTQNMKITRVLRFASSSHDMVTPIPCVIRLQLYGRSIKYWYFYVRNDSTRYVVSTRLYQYVQYVVREQLRHVL